MQYVVGRGDTYFVYFAIPLLDSLTDSSKNSCVAWLGHEFYVEVEHNLPAERRNEIMDSVEKAEYYYLRSHTIGKFEYLVRLNNSNEKDDYAKAIATNKKYMSVGKSPIILTAEHNRFDDRYWNSLIWVLTSFAIGSFLWLFMILIPKMDEEVEIEV